jgi:hypothetical protein
MLIKRLLSVAVLAVLATTAPACSSESGDRATTDAPAGSNEAEVKTHDSGGEMEAAMADTTTADTTAR